MADQAESGGVAGAGKPRKNKEGVFISYARRDGKHFAEKLRDRLERENITCWQDIVGMEGGRDWWMQIQDAINSVEFLVLVMTPAAMQSKTVRKEWRYARQQGVCVYPVIATPPTEADALLNALPRWMRDVHFYNLGQDTEHFDDGSNWMRFLNDLRTHCEVPRVPFMADDLGVYIQRSREYDALIDLLLDTDRDEPKAITSALALKGAGGYGKTTLARAICHDERIQEAFDDGVLWVTLGESATYDTVRDQLESLIFALSGERANAPTLEAAKTRLRELLAGRDILLVIDDLWNADYLRPFLEGGERVARLITTRMGETLPDGARKVDVNEMARAEAFALLTVGLPTDAVEGERASLHDLAANLMEYPLPIKLANGILRERVNDKKQLLGHVLVYLNELLEESGFAFGSRQSVVDAALRTSFDQLDEQELERYKRLAIFFDDTDIPLFTLQRLWDGRRAETEMFCDRLEKLSLLLRFDPVEGTIRLHDVIRDYLLRQGGSVVPRHGIVGEKRYGVAQSILLMPMDMYLITGGSVIDWQREFLNRYREPGPNLMLREKVKPIQKWVDLPAEEPYLWDALAYHLIEAASGDELIVTVLDLRYLAVKTHLRGAARVEADLEAAAAYATLNQRPQIAVVELLTRNYRNMAHILARCENVSDTLVTLYIRLSHLDALKPACDAVELELMKPHLAPHHPLPDLPHPALVRTLTGHTRQVNSAAPSPDGRWIVSASGDNTVRVWDAASGDLRFSLKGHWSGVNSVAPSPDGRWIVSASEDKLVRVWDAETGKLHLTLQGHTRESMSAAYSPDGRWIVSASMDNTVRVWDAASGDLRLTLAGHIDSVRSAAYSPDGRWIVSASKDNTVRVWDAASGELLLTLEAHSSYVKTAVYSPDGRWIVSALDDMVRVWDAASGKLGFTLQGHSQSVNSAAYSPDGRWIVSASMDNTVRVWEATGELRFTLTGHTHWVSSAVYSSDGRRIISASWDNTVRVWDATPSHGPLPEFREEKIRAFNGHKGAVNSAAYSPDGRWIVSASQGLFGFDKSVRVWDAASGELCSTLEGHTSYVNSAAYSPDGRRIVSASGDKTVRVWDAASGELRFTLEGHKSYVNSVVCSPDGRWILSASSDHTVRVWDAAAGNLRFSLEGHTSTVNSTVYSPDGCWILSASHDRTVRVWNGETKKNCFTLQGHMDEVMSAAFSPDGHWIVSASLDRTVRVWDGITGEPRFILREHTNKVSSAVYSPDGRWIVSASHDKTARVWDAATGKCCAVFYADVQLWCCSWSPDGKYLVAGGDAGYIYWLRWVG